MPLSLLIDQTGAIPGGATNYNQFVARGWESKSVEAQQADASEKSSINRRRLRPEEAARARNRETLILSRSRVLQQLESARNPRHQKSLQEALADLDDRIKRLGES